jgi:hypothetical protein
MVLTKAKPVTLASGVYTLDPSCWKCGEDYPQADVDAGITFCMNALHGFSSRGSKEVANYSASPAAEPRSALTLQ